MNNKGNLAYFTIPIIMITISITALIGLYIIREVNSSGAFDIYPKSETFMDNYTTNMKSVDFYPLLIFVAWLVALCVSALFTPSHPILFPVYLIAAAIALIIAAPVANIYIDAVNTDTLSATGGFLPITNHLMTNLPTYIAGGIALSWIFLFGGFKLSRSANFGGI